MKKTLLIAVLVTAALVTSGVVYAHMADGGWGCGAGAGNGPGWCLSGNSGNVNVDNLKKFQKETFGLRDELVTKRAELGNEVRAASPDSARIGELRKEIADLQAKIQQSAEKYGVTAGGRGTGRGFNRGSGMMYGSGYGPGCSRW